MTPLGTCLLLALVLPLAYLVAKRQYSRALCYGVFLLASQSRFLVFYTPGSMANATIHRIVLILLLLGWLRDPALRGRVRGAPMRRLFTFWLAAGSLSLAGSMDPGVSVRRYLSFILEIYVLFLLLSTSIRTPAQALAIARSVFLGLAVVAVLAVLERNAGFNPLPWLNTSSSELVAHADVISTMDHRILMGAGMAMGWPLGVGLLQVEGSRRRRTLTWVAVAMMLASCYWSTSRGPWLASVLVAATLLVLLPPRSRKPLLLLAVVAVIVLAAMPGVRDTLTKRAENTFAEDTLKHNTFMYRLELWRIAYAGISDSVWSFLFGNGPGAAGDSDFNWTLSYSGSDLEVWSWDNHYAALLYDTGMLGFLSFMALLATVFLYMLRLRSTAEGAQRTLLSCMIGSALVYAFMMSNVFIFAPQLTYVFWSLSAAALGMTRSFDIRDKALPAKQG
jgi:O-antigen ligase